MQAKQFFVTQDADLMQLSKYDRIAICLYRDLTKGMSPDSFPTELLFDLTDVRRVMHEAVKKGIIDSEVKNAADIKYTYDARRYFPPEIEQLGPMTWLQTGKGTYRLLRTRRQNLIDLAKELSVQPEIEYLVDPTPAFVAALLGTDEQAVFTRVRNVQLISQVLGFQAWPIQGHHRTTVSYGQIEIDEVQAGLDGGKATIVPISGKGGQDKLSWSQALNLNVYAKEKSRLADQNVRSLGLWRDSLNTIWTVEFSPQTDIDQIEIVNARRFVLKSQF